MTPLTEEHVRTVFREYASLSASTVLGRLVFRMAGVEAPRPITDESDWAARSIRAQAMADDRQRAISIVRLIGLLGVDEARVEAGPLSMIGSKDWRKIRGDPWRYSRWDHARLVIASWGEGPVPVLPEEVDAVYAALEEILKLDPQVRDGYRFEQEHGERLRADPDARTTPAGPRPRNVEARKWLGKKRPPSALASNRFGTIENGIAFVEELYAAGAKSVRVPGDAIDPDDGTGHAHADALIVVLPKDADARARVLAIARREANREGFEGDIDEGQPEIRLWWD